MQRECNLSLRECFGKLEIISAFLSRNDFVNALILFIRAGIVAIMPSRPWISAIDKAEFLDYKQAHILVSRGVCTNTGYCPKMSKDANG